mgnify:CR=1 FL=1|jgi:hypothetical protein
MKALLIIIVVLYTAFNLITAKLYSAREMKHDFIDGQCVVGKVFANIFYLPAWVLKGLRFIVVAVIK